MGRKIHYEVFKKRGPRSEWVLADAFDSRERAVKRAQTLIEDGEATGVKVIKETLNQDTGDYLSLKIFDQGDADETKAHHREKEAQLPCFRPQDLYTHHARATIARLLADYLARERLTAIELIHRADALERLSATGTTLQHAIQKAAVAHAGSTGQNVQDAVRKLNELTAKGTERLYKDSRADIFPNIGVQGLAGIIATVEAAGEPDYVLAGAIAKRLAKSKGWGGKLAAVLELMAHLPEAEEPRDRCLATIDCFVSEMLAGRAAIQDLLGEQPTLGASLDALANLFLGRINGDDKTILPGVGLLSDQFKAGKLPNARAAIGQRILSELRSPRRLEPDGLEQEVRRARQLASKMVMGQGKFLSVDEVLDAFTKRSKRLVSPESIDEFLTTLANPHEKLEKLIGLEENIVGDENKRSLAAFVEPLLKAHGTERYFIETTENVIEQLRTLSGLQKQVLKSGFQPHNRKALADGIDAIAHQVAIQADMFTAIARRPISTIDKVVALLRLIVSGVVTEGRLMDQTKKSITAMIRDPSFMRTLTPSEGREAVSSDRLQEFKGLMQKVDLNDLSSVA